MKSVRSVAILAAILGAMPSAFAQAPAMPKFGSGPQVRKPHQGAAERARRVRQMANQTHGY